MANEYHKLSTSAFTQNWTNTGLITVNDNWSAVSSIVGYRGDDLTATTGVDPQTVIADGTTTPVDIIANQNNPNTLTDGGVAEFALTDPVVALQGSGAADAPFLLIHLDTSGVTNVNISYTLRDIDGSADNSIQPVALQYRVGTSGNFINIPAAFVTDASSGPSLATQTTTVNATLPAAAENQSQVQLRIMTANALGNDEWIGIDDINISAAPARPNIQITEYMYDGTNGEFVEFTNLGTTPVDMTGWSFDDNSRTSGSFSLSGFGIVQPNESVILTESAAAGFRTAWNLASSVKVIGGLTQNLARADEINLYDNNGQLIDRLTYGDQIYTGTIRTQNTSGWTRTENLNSEVINTDWVLSTVGDAKNSNQSNGSEIGNPGFYVTTSTPITGVTITQTDGTTRIAEGGATDTYTLVLNKQPTANVTIAINSSTQTTTAPTFLTFTTANWNVAQTVTVTAVNDTAIEGDHSGTITHTATSTDTNYNGISIPSVAAAITDNDFGILKKIGSFAAGALGAEISSYDPVSKRLFVIDGSSAAQILNFSDPTNPTLISTINLSAYGAAATSVAIKNGLVAFSVAANVETDPGKVFFYDAAGNFIKDVTVGALPDMITFSPDGTKVLTANEGQPGNTIDPVGSVSIINIANGAANATVTTASFTSFDGQEATLRSQGVRIFPNKKVSEDVEPEYIAFSKDGAKAWVTLQENNAVAVVDIATATVNSIVPLGLVDYSQPENGLDASDRDGSINIKNYPVFGMYMPDAIASFEAGGRTYYITANEGDTRNENARVSTLNLDATKFPDAATLKLETNLGRLDVSTIGGDTDGDGDYDRLLAYGARSFTIWDDQGKLVYNSGDQFERITASQIPSLFNAEGTAVTFDTRSDNKGPEPEGAAIGVIDGRTYAFVGLERTGGVMVYEVTNPQKPLFVQYLPNQTGDLSPEGVSFIPAAESPNGKNLLVLSHEVSNTVAVFEVNPQTRISNIQGAAHTSPLNGQAVRNVPGIVTALRTNGFYLQDPNPDSNDATSEGIFVFTSSAPTVAVGDSVQVSGTVSEFRPGGSTSNNLTTTQISSPTIIKLSSGNALPIATILGNGGRAIPNQVISNDAVGGTVENPGTVFDPAQDGIDFYESVEGMLVQVNNPVAVGPTNNFGEIPVLADNGANASTRTARGGIIIQPTDFNPERILIDDTLVANPPQVNVGDKFNGSVVGVMDYSFSNFKLFNTQALPSVTSGSLQKEVTGLTPNPNQLTVGTFNVENLDPNDGDTKFNNIANRIVNNLKAPDIITIEEIQDNNGATNDTVVDASQTYNKLISAIAAAGGPTYQFRQINPVDDQDGGEPGGNIRVGFLFNPNRVLFVERAGATSTSNTTVNNVGGVPQLSASPGRLDPTNTAFNASRKPLVGEFVFQGQTIYIVGNHFNSKGGDQPLFGRFQPPTLTSETQRNQQATIVKDFVQSILTINPNANVVVMGDLNDFEFSNPINTLESAGLKTLIESLPENERYTYNFEGNAQSLDHIMVSNNLFNNLDGFDVVHINSEFADQDSDHDPSVARFNIKTPANQPKITNYDFTNLPKLGTTSKGQDIFLGGFSGLYFQGLAPNGNLKFVTHTDRGPNGEPTGQNRPFLLPNFQPEIVSFELKRSTGEITITKRTGLFRQDGTTKLTGLPNLQAAAGGLAYTDEIGVDLDGKTLPNDPLGADLEGIVVAENGDYWMVDEYRPAIYHFDINGKLLNRFIPKGTATAPEPDQPAGIYGTEVLPEVYAQRRNNRGFEAVALEGNKLYAFIQSGIDNPDSTGDTTSRNSRNLRILEFDIVSKAVTGEYLYLLDDITASGLARTDKIGDAVSLGNGKFAVVERDDISTTASNKLIYQIDLAKATNINNPANFTLPTGKTIEQLTEAELTTAKISPVTKSLIANAAQLGYTGVEKLEGLALVAPNTLALINDNDFNVTGTTPVERLGILELPNNLPVAQSALPNNVYLTKATDSDTFTLTGGRGKPKLQVSLTGRNSGLVNELGVFTVDDATTGKIGNLAPGAAGYAEAALARSKTILSVISNAPNGFNQSELNRLLEFGDGDKLRFYLVKNSTNDAVRANSALLGNVVFADPTTQRVIANTDGSYSLDFKDGSGSDNNLVVKIQSSTQLSLPLGTNLQGQKEGEVFDLRSTTGRVKVDFTVNREAAFNNVIGFYKVADENGGIDITGDGKADITPAQAGYAQAAMNARVADINLAVANQGTATFNDKLLTGGSIFAPFLLTDGRTVDQVLAGQVDRAYFAYLGANSDKVDHVRLLGNNTFGFEDIAGGGDLDYNDIIVKATLTPVVQ